MKRDLKFNFQLLKSFLLILVFSNSDFVIAQPQSRLWTIPPMQIEFCAQPTYSTLEYNPLNVLSYAGGAALNLSNSVHDVNGKLIFYVVNEDIADGVILYDITGRKIDEYVFKGDGVLTINTSNYAKGVYVCILLVNGKQIDRVKLAIVK